MAADYSVAEAAVELGISERTLREWVRTGKAASFQSPPPQRGKRLTAEEVDRLRPLVPATSGNQPQPAGSTERQPPVDSGGQQQAAADSGKLHELERALAVAEAELRAVTSDRDFLRGQVDRHATAEAELRVLMLRQSEQIQALQMAQEQKALPEPKKPWWASPQAPENTAVARPWWAFWRRG